MTTVSTRRVGRVAPQNQEEMGFETWNRNQPATVEVFLDALLCGTSSASTVAFISIELNWTTSLLPLRWKTCLLLAVAGDGGLLDRLLEDLPAGALFRALSLCEVLLNSLVLLFELYGETGTLPLLTSLASTAMKDDGFFVKEGGSHEVASTCSRLSGGGPMGVVGRVAPPPEGRCGARDLALSRSSVSGAVCSISRSEI